MDYVYTFLKNKQKVVTDNASLNEWVERFEADKHTAAYDFWYEIHKGNSRITEGVPGVAKN
jgi:glyceraldehyde-3-phosphate dehydrogenase (ferredoxin)